MTEKKAGAATKTVVVVATLFVICAIIVAVPLGCLGTLYYLGDP